jgi:hypothetical protein
LLWVGTLVDEHYRSAVAEMHRGWKVDEESEVEPIEIHIAMASALDPPRPSALAEAAARWCLKFAGTAVIAAASLGVIGLEVPFHGSVGRPKDSFR